MWEVGYVCPVWVWVKELPDLGQVSLSLGGGGVEWDGVRVQVGVSS